MRILSLTILCAAPLMANSGVPMIIFTLPGMVVLLLPVIALETFIVRRGFTGWWPALRTVSAANLFSTLIGVPWAWLQLCVIPMVFQIMMIPFSIFTVRLENTPVEISNAVPQWPDLLRGVLMSPAWVIPFRRFERSLYWTVPLSMLILLIPYWYASYRSEMWMAEVMLRWRGESIPQLAQLIFRANVWSYVVIGAGVLAWLMWSVTVYSQGT